MARPGHRRALPVAADFFPRTLCHRTQDKPRRSPGRTTAVFRLLRLERQHGPPGSGHAGQLSLPVRGPALPGELPEFHQDCADSDGAVPAAGFSHGLCHCAHPLPLAQPVVAAGDPAVLDLLPAAGIRLDGDAGQAGPDQPAAAVFRPGRRAPAVAVHRLGRRTWASFTPTCRS